MWNKTLFDTNTKKKIPQFCVGYVWLLSLKQHKKFWDKAHNTIGTWFNQEALIITSKRYNDNKRNASVITIIMLYKNNKTIMFKIVG